MAKEPTATAAQADEAPQDSGTVRLQWTPAFPTWAKQEYTDTDTKTTWTTTDGDDGLVREVSRADADRLLAIKSDNAGSFKEAK